MAPDRTYERELITEPVDDGIAATRASGTRFGRPPVEARAKAVQLRTLPGWLVGWVEPGHPLYRHQAEAERALTAKTSAR